MGGAPDGEVPGLQRVEQVARVDGPPAGDDFQLLVAESAQLLGHLRILRHDQRETVEFGDVAQLLDRDEGVRAAGMKAMESPQPPVRRAATPASVQG